tara:strand:- start:6620 stop:7246 length:627 start_codon:yes stop_codon:yes gene_type:complete
MIENEDLWTSDFWVNKNYEINDEAKEGHVGIYPNKIENLVKYSKMINSGSLIAEIGFNLGHSAHTILSNADNPKRFVSFDICIHQYVKPSWEFFKKHYDCFETVDGDTRITLPDFTNNNQGIFDLVHLDGGHKFDVAASDIENSKNLVKLGGYIIVDDTNINTVGSALSVSDMSNFKLIETIKSRSGGSQSAPGKIRTSEVIVFERTA